MARDPNSGDDTRVPASLADQRGGSYVQGLILVSLVALGALGAFRALGDEVSNKADCTGQAVAAFGPVQCAAAQGGQPPGQPGQPGAPPPAPEAPNGPTSGPAIIGPGPLVVLPFPGTASVTCTGLPGQNQKERCKGKDGNGVSVEVVGEVSAERSRVRLDGRAGGCPKVDLAVSGKVTVQATGKAEGKTVGGSLSIFTATNTRYSVSVSPEAAEAIERGDRQPPNPLDPRSLVPGESIELAQEFYSGHNLTATYRKLQVDMGFEEGRKLSSGVRRVDDRTVRVMVGDSDFVRNALSLGTSVGEFGVAIGGNKQLSQGEIRSVDIDISTPEGFAAYQKFIADGQLPQSGPGISNPLAISALDYSGSTTAEVKAGRFKLGGVLNDAEGSIIEVRHADGTVDHISQARYNDVGAAVTENRNGKNYSLFMENVDPSLIEAFEHFSGKDLAEYGDGNVRMDFTEGDLQAIRQQALDQLVQRARDNGSDISREELERMLREDPRRLENAGMNDSFDRAFEIARAETPEDILRELYYMGGAGSNGSTAMNNLLAFQNATARARHGDRAIPRDHPDSVLPGTSKPPPGCALE
jgi:hypothetical protein